MMHRKYIAGIAAAACLMAGCVAIHPEVDRRAGEAVTSVQSAQTLNHGPVRDPNAVSGIDGRAANESMNRYVESFRAPPPNTNVINIGGSLSDQRQ
jgi:hypothetical protein